MYKVIYLDEETHQKAKEKAVKEKSNLKEYLTKLINEDNS